MTDRHTVDSLTSDALDQLYDDLDQARTHADPELHGRLTAAIDALGKSETELKTARATNQRLNLRAQQLESELAAYRRAVASWQVSERGTYITHASLQAIGKAGGVDLLGSVRHLKHFERVEQAEATIDRVRNLAGRIRQGVPWTVNDDDIAAHILRALDEDQAPAEPPVHIGGGANAEDCPACKGTNPPYPFICPGPDAEQPERTTVKNSASDYEQTTGHAITCGAGFGMGCQCDEPADLTGYIAPDPPIRCLTVTAEPDPFGYEERERTGRNAGLVLPAATEATDAWQEPTHPHPCTAAIEGRATPGGRRVQCTREARHPENHVGPKQGANGRVLWTDWSAGATPHEERP